jgi:hypothetical protein
MTVDRGDRLGLSACSGPAEDQATLTLAIGVALPSIGRLHDGTNPERGQTATSPSTRGGHNSRNGR